MCRLTKKIVREGLMKAQIADWQEFYSFENHKYKFHCSLTQTVVLQASVYTP